MLAPMSHFYSRCFESTGVPVRRKADCESVPL